MNSSDFIHDAGSKPVAVMDCTTGASPNGGATCVGKWRSESCHSLRYRLALLQTADRFRRLLSAGVAFPRIFAVRARTVGRGSATSAQLESPAGVAVDSVGNIYVADSYNNGLWQTVGRKSVSSNSGKKT